MSIFICDGQPLWLCFGLCVLDIVGGSIALFFVTSRTGSSAPTSSEPPSGPQRWPSFRRRGLEDDIGGETLLFTLPWVIEPGGKPMDAVHLDELPSFCPSRLPSCSHFAQEEVALSVRSSMVTFGSMPRGSLSSPETPSALRCAHDSFLATPLDLSASKAENARSTALARPQSTSSRGVGVDQTE